jgi:voltage-gated potassium channel Kch
MLISHLIIGTILMVLTVVIHAVALDRLMQSLKKYAPIIFKNHPKTWKIIILAITVMTVFLSHIVQIWLWAVFYLAVNALPDFEEALYFSTTTFTTVGYGDVFLDKEWRLLSAFQSANGFIMFGWSTAFIFEIMSKLYKEETLNKTAKKS